MNRFKKILAILPIAVASFGCSDSFFTKTPQDALDASKLSPAQFEGLLNNCYWSVGNAYNAFQDGFADNGYSRNSWDSYGKLVQTNTIAADTEFEYDDFGYLNGYMGIRKCNAVFEVADKLVGVSDAIKTDYLAQARAIRALIYMKLTLFYGDVPLVTSVSNDFGKEGIAQTSKEEIRKWVLSEYDKAIADLPEGKVKGRISKAVAYAMKARAAYYFGDYAAAKVAARYVIDNGGYSLHTTTDYTKDATMLSDAAFFEKMVDFDANSSIDKSAFIQGIFNYEDLFQTDGNKEVILAAEYQPSESLGDWQRVTCFMTPNMTGYQAWNTMAPIQQIVDAYWSLDGKTKPTLPTVAERQASYASLIAEVNSIQKVQGIPFNAAVTSIAAALPSKEYMQQYRNRDSRLYASITFPFAAINKYRTGYYQQYVPTSSNYGETGFAWRKWATLKQTTTAWGGGYLTSGVDFSVIRLAEMLLIYAEAETQTTGYDAAVVAELNKLRDRCGMPHVPTGLSKTDALDFIRKERRLELSAEGLRYMDIRLYEDSERNGGYKGTEAASIVMQGSVVDPVTKRSSLVWDNRLMYLPFPTSAMDRNKALKQNTGY